MTISKSRLAYEAPKLEVHYLLDEPSVLAVSKCKPSHNHSHSKDRRPSKEKCSNS